MVPVPVRLETDAMHETAEKDKNNDNKDEQRKGPFKIKKRKKDNMEIMVHGNHSLCFVTPPPCFICSSLSAVDSLREVWKSDVEENLSDFFLQT